MHRHTKRGLRGLIDAARVEEAICRAEGRSTGELRVSVAPFFWGRVRHSAERAFARLGMERTRERNGVLFFLVPSRRKLVVLGDIGVHAKVGQAFWDEVVEAVSARFKEGDFTGGLLEGIDRVGRKLAKHFPPKAKDIDELPQKVDFGEPPP
ncbi:MAG: TPM domain-containing protein [Myxococcales bacterium]|nr:TPM domain-containing protein [Myxococcales bacterium]